MWRYNPHGTSQRNLAVTSSREADSLHLYIHLFQMKLKKWKAEKSGFENHFTCWLTSTLGWLSNSSTTSDRREQVSLLQAVGNQYGFDNRSRYLCVLRGMPSTGPCFQPCPARLHQPCSRCIPSASSNYLFTGEKKGQTSTDTKNWDGCWPRSEQMRNNRSVHRCHTSFGCFVQWIVNRLCLLGNYNQAKNRIGTFIDKKTQNAIKMWKQVEALLWFKQASLHLFHSPAT